MGELILHIGTTKTGSTSLQKFLFDNRTLLAEHGVCFPEFTRQPEPSPRRNGIFINRLCVSLARGQIAWRHVRDPEENLERLARALSSDKRVLLTDENFSCSEGWLFSAGCSPALFWRTLAQTLHDAGAQGIVIVVYLRRQDDWAASGWKQNVKSGWCKESLEAFYNLPTTLRSMDYAGMLENAEAAFGNEAKIVVRRYDRSTFEGGDIYHDFCAAVGIPWDDAYQLPKSEVNTSLTFDVAEAMRAFADAAPPRTSLRMDVLIPLALKLSREAPDSRGTTPFDEEATRELMASYLEGNGRISERYLGGEPLFSEEYGGRPVWVPDEERIAECQAILQEAIDGYRLPSSSSRRLRALARSLPEGIKAPLRTAREKLFGR